MGERTLGDAQLAKVAGDMRKAKLSQEQKTRAKKHGVSYAEIERAYREVQGIADPDAPKTIELTFEGMPGKYIIHPSGAVYHNDGGTWRKVQEPLASRIREKAEEKK